MSTEPFVGEVKVLGFNFPPRGYMTCQGQTLSIAQYTAMFALLGTTFGGNGQTTFALPDLQGRVPIGQGQGRGLSPYDMGEEAGSESVTITQAQMPMHVHPATGLNVRIPVNTGNDDAGAAGNYIGNSSPNDMFGSVPSPTASLGAPIVGGTTSVAGGSQPMGILSPYLCMNYSIAVEGIFPSRN